MTTLTFQNTALSVIDQNNQKWMPALEVGRALGYKNPSSDISKLYERNKDEFTSSMTAIIDMDTASGMQKVRIFSLRGCWLLGMRSHTKVAKDFRKWVLDVLDAEIAKNSTALPEPTTLTPEEQNQVQNAVKATHNRTGLSYGEIWARVKNKFKVAKYDQIERVQLRDVLIYIASMSAIRTAGKNDIIIPADLFEAIMKHTRLAKYLAEKTETFHRQLYEMLGLERYIRNDLAAMAYDVKAEFNPFLDQGEEILARHKQFRLPNF